MLSAILAVDKQYGIGKNGVIPWHFISWDDLAKTSPETMDLINTDMEWFSTYTAGKHIVMGGDTWRSLSGDRWRSLSGKLRNRFNIVISTTIEEGADLIFHNIVDFLEWFYENNIDVVIIGGAKIYSQFISMGIVSEIYISHIPGNFNCDVSFNTGLLNNYNQKRSINRGNRLIISVYSSPKNDEAKLLKFMKRIRESGDRRLDRTGVGALSLFGFDIRFPLNNNRFPLLTSRKLPFRQIFEELMWILRGQTNTKILEEKGVNIWSGNSTQEFLERQGLPWKEGDIGPSYGFLMRHFGDDYHGTGEEYKGFDQLSHLINTLRTNPYDRRLILSLWDPSKIHQMALPPCLYNYQFFVSGGMLSCKATQRSSDIVLAGGWNIATTSLLTILLARVCDLLPGEIIWSVGDAHIYINQLTEQLDEYLERVPSHNPLLFLLSKKNILEYEFSDLKLIGYKPQKNIKIAFNA